MHIHWHRKVGPVWGPYALTANGPIGSQLLRCRCGHERWRDAVATREDVQACYPIKVALAAWPHGLAYATNGQKERDAS